MGTGVSPYGADLQRQPTAREVNDASAFELGIASFDLAVEQQGSTLYLRLRGEFDRACVGRVESALARVSPAVERVVFDLLGLTFIDLAGLRAILRTDERARTEAFEVVVVPPQGAAERLFTLACVVERLNLADHVPGAIQAPVSEPHLPRG